jgi:hypothetical protein
MLDKDRLTAGLAALFVSLLVASHALLPVVFADPPTTPRQLRRAYAEKALAAVASCFAGIVSGPWAAGLVNQAIEKFSPLHLQVDTMSAGVVVGVVVATLVADPTARDRLRSWLAAKIKGDPK